MLLTDEEADKINEALEDWRQGDFVVGPDLEFLHLADINQPLSPAAQQISISLATEEEVATGPTPILDEVAGFVILTQTCDIVRDCRQRPFVEVAPLVSATAEELEGARRLRRVALGYLAGAAAKGLVADLDRTMTLEKAIMAGWKRVPGWDCDAQLRDFVDALTRKRSRFAFPDDFNEAVRPLQKRLSAKHDKHSDEGAHLQALTEIRVRAAPSWDDEQVQLNWWFIKESDPEIKTVDWSGWAEKWMNLFSNNKRFTVNSQIVCRLEDMTAREYVESDRLDLDRLSSS